MKNRLQVAMVLFSVASVQPTLALGPTGSAANDHFYSWENFRLKENLGILLARYLRQFLQKKKN
jgi:hypothetical protein